MKLGALPRSACVAFESVTVAVSGGRRASWHEAIVLARGVHECSRWLTGLGLPIYPRIKHG